MLINSEDQSFIDEIQVKGALEGDDEELHEKSYANMCLHVYTRCPSLFASGVQHTTANEP